MVSDTQRGIIFLSVCLLTWFITASTVGSVDLCIDCAFRRFRGSEVS